MEEEVANPQVECAKVTDAIEVEKLDSNLYRSLAKHLWVPARARGVFGGQVISQALVSATNTVDSAFHLHSMHCYFLLSATPAPILYHIDRVRDGRSYCTRAVRAHQNGRMVFVVICSFQKPEPWQVTLRPSPPPDVPKPEECKFAWENAREHANSPNATPRQRVYLSEYAEEREKSFLQIKPAGKRLEPNGDKLWFYWFRVDGMPEGNSSFQKCILGYISDSHFIGAAHRTLGLNGSNPPGPTRLGMSSTLDHSIWFYNNDFDCGDWILYVMHAPSVGSGRGLVFGKMFTQSGELIALMTQEGVVRADIRDPSLSKPSQAKL